jgi:hypothetical protein
MKMTQNYGANNSKYDEAGRVMEPKPVWTKYENFGDPARSASRNFDEGYFRHLVKEYHAKHGKLPRKAYSTMGATTLKTLGYIDKDLGYVGLDIIPGQDCDRVGD